MKGVIYVPIRNICRIIEYDLGFMKLECKDLKTIAIYTKRKGDVDFYYVKTIINSVNEIMTVDTLLQDFLREHALGNKITELVQLSLVGVDYDTFVFSKSNNGDFISVEYVLGTPNIMKNRWFQANYYDLNQLLYISNNLMGNYMQQRETLRKEREKLIEKFSKKKRSN